MALKKFTSFAGQGKSSKPLQEREPKMYQNAKEEQLPNLQPMKTKASFVNPPDFVEEKPFVQTKNSMVGPNESMEFNGKVVSIKNISSASDAFMMLENKNISKNKLWYFILERQNELVVAKYNSKVGFKLKDLVVDMFQQYEKGAPEIKTILEKIKIDGKDEFARIINAPTKFRDIIKGDLIKLLSR